MAQIWLNYLAVVIVALYSVTLTNGQTTNTPAEPKVVCYYTFWSHTRVAPYGLTPDRIDPFVCTHIIYAFGTIGSENQLLSADPDFDFKDRAYANITALKKRNKNLKVMLGIGGWVAGTLGFARISASEKNRTDFAKTAVRYIRGYQFDGLDLNWQHPTLREGGKSDDRENYVLLSQALRDEFDKDAAATGRPRLLLSIAITHNQNFLPGYDIANFNNYMDFISVICYDYHFSFESAVNHHSPLFALEEDNEYNYDAKINTNYTINFFMELADKEKLILGIPIYGRTYKLENPDDTDIGSYADGPGDAGIYTGSKGFLAYYEICQILKNESWTVKRPYPDSVGPYAYQGNQWVGYDDIDIVKKKADYAKETGLGGVMFWTVDFDDFTGSCGQGTFPIIKAARDVLLGPIPTDVMMYPDDDEDPNFELKQNIERERERAKSMAENDKKPSESDNTESSSVPSPKMNRVPQESPLRSPPTRVPQQNVLVTSAPDTDSTQANAVQDLIRLFEKAGGVGNLSKLLRQIKTKSIPNTSSQQGYTNDDDSENSIVFQTPRLPPILLVLTNSSVYIKEVNIYPKGGS